MLSNFVDTFWVNFYGVILSLHTAPLCPEMFLS